MNTWKFLLLGITGDLAKRKILPALSEFSYNYRKELDIQLIGYSRSKPNEDEINTILASEHGVNPLMTQTFLQGEYSENNFFYDIIGSLGENERFVSYLAVPPHVFVKFLQNSCPFSKNPIDILIEKPFGSSLDEAEKILSIINACDLHSRVHFCDHYLFKHQTFLTAEMKQKFELFKGKKLSRVNVVAKEKLDVAGRSGYYDQYGALKDMLPHLYSLFQLGFGELGLSCEKIDFSNIAVHTWGQYRGYNDDVKTEHSTTETRFHISLDATSCEQTFSLEFESGKKLEEKRTEIRLEFVDGDYIVWNITPSETVTFGFRAKETVLKFGEDNKLDHTRTFEMVLANDNSRFVTDTNILDSWRLYDMVIQQIQQDKVEVSEY